MSLAEISFVANINKDEFDKVCETALVFLPGYELAKEDDSFQLKETNGMDPDTGAFDVIAEISCQDNGIYTVSYDLELEPNNTVFITAQNPGIGSKQKARCEAVAAMIKSLLIANILSGKESQPNREDLILDQIEILSALNMEKMLTDEEFSIVRKALLLCF